MSTVTDIVREGDRDRYIAALFAPPQRRDALVALHAFDLELARIPLLARQQIASDIRLQWWRQAVDGSNEHEALANPVAAALMSAIATHGLPREALQAMIDARSHELMPEPFAEASDLLRWCDGVWGSQLACAGRILDAGRAGEGDAVAREAGRAIGVTQMLMSFAARAARGQSVVPAALLAAHGARAADVTAGPRAGRAPDGVAAALADLRALARRHLDLGDSLLPGISPTLRPAFLMLAPVAPRLRWLERHARAPYASGDVPQLTRMWRMWRFSRRA